jgi:hypothetical protein
VVVKEQRGGREEENGCRSFKWRREHSVQNKTLHGARKGDMRQNKCWNFLKMRTPLESFSSQRKALAQIKTQFSQ